MKRAGLIFFLAGFAGSAGIVGAADAQQNPALPTITFDRVWEAYTPQEVTITVQSTGSAKYISRNPFTPPDAGSDPDYMLDFTLSRGTRKSFFAMPEKPIISMAISVTKNMQSPAREKRP